MAHNVYFVNTKKINKMDVKSINIFILLLMLFMITNKTFSQEEKCIGLIPSFKYDKKERIIVPDFQQIVWESILRSKTLIKNLNYDFHLLEKEELSSIEKLKHYESIILPMMDLLSKEKLENLKEYVRQGGRLIREQASVSYLDMNNNSILEEEECTEESKKFVTEFWKEVGGTIVGSKYYNFVKLIRFTTAFPILSKGLPTEYIQVDLPFKSPVSPVYLTTFYITLSAQTIAEAKIIHINSWDLNADPKELEGAFPVITINKYGEGYCISIGINLARVLYSNYPTEIYHTFYKNLIYWVFQKEEVIK